MKLSDWPNLRLFLKKDQSFKKNYWPMHISFTQNATKVFDNVISESIPCYKEMHKVLGEWVHGHIPKNGEILDLGCATGTSLVFLREAFPKLTLRGIDISEAMIRQAKNKIKDRKVSLVVGDILEADLGQPHGILANYVLQFIPKHLRLTMLKKIYEALKPGGFFFFSEKIETQAYWQKPFNEAHYRYYIRQNKLKLNLTKKKDKKINEFEEILSLFPWFQWQELLFQAGFWNPELLLAWHAFRTFIVFKN